jgi:hypothetical protein
MSETGRIILMMRGDEQRQARLMSVVDGTGEEKPIDPLGIGTIAYNTPRHHERRPEMLARVTTWEGGTADGIRAAASEMQSNIAQGPPPGVKSTGITMLVDPEGGRVLMIGLFANEDDLNASEPVLKQMNPPAGIGSRSALEIFEVAAEARL